MRFLPILVVATLPLVAVAQNILPGVQKAAMGPLATELSAEALGLPANPDAAKMLALAAGKRADAQPSDFDSDKIVGNAPEPVAMGPRAKAASSLPDPAPTAAGLGTGPQDEKTLTLDAGKSETARVTTYDSDKIDGNPEVTPPLLARQKAPGTLPGGLSGGVAEADFGLPADPDAAKTANIAASHAEGAATIYDEDKITGNEPPPAPLTDRQKAASSLMATEGTFEPGIPANPPLPKVADLAVSAAARVPGIYDDDKIDGNAVVSDTDDPDLGPLAERQKYPSELAQGADPTTFGQPVIDAPKVDLAVSKAALSQPNVEDYDKIAGNPYVTPPLLPRQKAPAILPDPVADADMGQPAIDAPKVDLAVSKATLSQPNVEDYDKIAGNPVITPPLSERSKGPAWDIAVAGLSDADLGLPVDAGALKAGDVAVGKAVEGVATIYDEDKIAGNEYVDPTLSDDYGYDSGAYAPPAELVAAVRALLDDPATRTATLDGITARGMAPANIAAPFQSFVAALYDVPQVRDIAATDIARVFDEMGLNPENPAAVARMATEYLSAFGDTEAARGIARLPASEHRGYLTDTLRVAETLPAEQCGPFLDGTMPPVQLRQVLLGAIATWPEAAVQTALIRQAAAAIAEVQDDPAFVELPVAEVDRAKTALGTAAITAIDATENPTALLLAYGDPLNAAPADLCAVHKLILRAALDTGGAEGDLLIRYLVDYGWAN